MDKKSAEQWASDLVNEGQAFEKAMVGKPSIDELEQAYRQGYEAGRKSLEEKHWQECGQIAQYESDLKQAKALLYEAVKGFRKLGKALNDDSECGGDCIYCPINNHGNCLKWERELEALKLIGGQK